MAIDTTTGFRFTSLWEARHSKRLIKSVMLYLDPLASGRLDRGQFFKKLLFTDLDPLASGRLDHENSHE